MPPGTPGAQDDPFAQFAFPGEEVPQDSPLSSLLRSLDPEPSSKRRKTELPVTEPFVNTLAASRGFRERWSSVCEAHFLRSQPCNGCLCPELPLMLLFVGLNPFRRKLGDGTQLRFSHESFLAPFGRERTHSSFGV